MSKPEPGFVLPPSAPPQYPGYPSQQPTYPNPYPPQSYPGNQPFPAPIQQQPNFNNQPINWYSRNVHGYLTSAISFHVKQKVELLEALVGWETGNKYTVMDQNGHKIFYVGEESNLCGRQFCGSRRPFTLTVKDTTGQTMLVIDRNIDCSCCFGLLFPDSVQVTTPSGQLLGTVEQTFNILYPTFKIKDANKKTVLRIQGPICPMSCGGAVVFRVMNKAGVSVGTISKEWSGLVREFLTDADNFSISFPCDLDPSVKSVLLAALFLIDYEYFENTESRSNRTLFG